MNMRRALLVVLGGAAAVIAAAAIADAAAKGSNTAVRGGGTTMVRGGTGSPSFVPVITKVAFHWSEGRGGFECLALAPSAAADEPDSGEFDTNVMYVTGDITSATVEDRTAVLRGSATVTGIGAGSNRPFTATLTRGGPGATLVLEVSGLTFSEILLDGRFAF